MTAEGRRPREKGNSHRGLALPFGGDLGGNAAHIIKQSKGAQNRPVPRPLSPSKCPHARKEKISNGDNKIAAWLGRETRVVIETYDDPNRAAKEAAEALVRHILNWGSEEKAPPKQGLGAQGVRGRGFRSRTIRDTRASSRKKSPAEAGHKRGNGKRIQTAQSFDLQGRRPSALGHDGRWRWIFANRSLADRPLANRRRRRRRRLPARQVDSGGSAQHRQGCSQRS